MHVERRIACKALACDLTQALCIDTKQRADLVIHTGEVRMVREVECLCDQLQVVPFAEFERAAQTHVEIRECRSQPGISAGTDRPVVRIMAIAINIR